MKLPWGLPKACTSSPFATDETFLRIFVFVFWDAVTTFQSNGITISLLYTWRKRKNCEKLMYLQKKRKNLANGVWATVKNYHRKVELAYNSKKLPLSPTCTSNFLLRKNLRIIDNDVFSWYNGKAQKHRGSVSKWSQRPALEMRLPSNRYKGSNPFASAKRKARQQPCLF